MRDSPSEKQDGEEIDPGEPIAALAGFEHDTSSRFLGTDSAYDSPPHNCCHS